VISSIDPHIPFIFSLAWAIGGGDRDTSKNSNKKEKSKEKKRKEKRTNKKQNKKQNQKTKIISSL